jgi:CubicO group peptidase (beta-lactamase class C family)
MNSPWPVPDWEVADVPPDVDVERLMEPAFDDDTGGGLGQTLAVVIVHRGRVVLERYGPDTDAATTLISWSMAKSFLHAAVGILRAEGHFQLDERPEVPEWSAPDDPRREITLEHLLTMRDGLDFVEDYVDERASDVIRMLFGEGKDDVAHFAADRPLAHRPGERFYYSSGTTNIVSRFVGQFMGDDAPSRERWLRERLLDPLGMTNVSLSFDAAGTWIASSFLYATACDFARFGYLYLRDGEWNGRRLLPEGWVAHASVPRPGSVDEDTGNLYGAHWWVKPPDGARYWASGYEGQRIVVDPRRDVVVVRLGKTAAEDYPALRRWVSDVVEAFSPLD